LNSFGTQRHRMRSTDEAGALDFRDFCGFGGDEGESHWQSPHLPLPSGLSFATAYLRSFMTSEEIESTVKSVIGSLVDGTKGFKEIGEKLEDPTLKTFFLEESAKRAAFREELEAHLSSHGVKDAKEDGSISGSIHRTWGDLKAKLGGGDHTLLETAEQGEDAAKKVYVDALGKDLPLHLCQILSTQYSHVKSSHDYVKAARDSRN
jgi:uncharacterized protein (TIGR02284 family)